MKTDSLHRKMVETWNHYSVPILVWSIYALVIYTGMGKPLLAKDGLTIIATDSNSSYLVKFENRQIKQQVALDSYTCFFEIVGDKIITVGTPTIKALQPERSGFANQKRYALYDEWGEYSFSHLASQILTKAEFLGRVPARELISVDALDSIFIPGHWMEEEAAFALLECRLPVGVGIRHALPPVIRFPHILNTTKGIIVWDTVGVGLALYNPKNGKAQELKPPPPMTPTNITTAVLGKYVCTYSYIDKVGLIRAASTGPIEQITDADLHINKAPPLLGFIPGAASIAPLNWNGKPAVVVMEASEKTWKAIWQKTYRIVSFSVLSVPKGEQLARVKLAVNCNSAVISSDGNQAYIYDIDQKEVMSIDLRDGKLEQLGKYPKDGDIFEGSVVIIGD